MGALNHFIWAILGHLQPAQTPGGVPPMDAIVGVCRYWNGADRSPGTSSERFCANCKFALSSFIEALSSGGYVQVNSQWRPQWPNGAERGIDP
jgi:hypothetical protein